MAKYSEKSETLSRKINNLLLAHLFICPVQCARSMAKVNVRGQWTLGIWPVQCARSMAEVNVRGQWMLDIWMFRGYHFG